MKNRKIIISLLIILAIIQSIHAQYQTIDFYPGDTTHKWALSFHDNDIYCIANPNISQLSNYQLFKSSNFGDSWTLLNSFQQNINLMGFVSFNDSSHITIGKGMITKTYNQFDSVIIIMSQVGGLYPTTIKALNKDTVLIYSNGIIFRSNDGFTTWDTIMIQNGLVTKHTFANDEINLISEYVWFAYMEHDHSIIRTTDGGNHWLIVNDLSSYISSGTNPEVLINFHSLNEGILMIENVLYSTSNGGLTLIPIFTAPFGNIFDINSFSNGHILVMASQSSGFTPMKGESLIYYSRNYGFNWDTIDIYLSNQDYAFNLISMNDSLAFAITYAGKLFKLNLTTLSVQTVQLPNRKLKLFPNPTTNLIQINTNGIYKGTYTIIDVNGKVIQEDKFHKKEFKVNTSKLKSGIYYIRVQGNSKSEITTEKFIKL